MHRSPECGALGTEARATVLRLARAALENDLVRPGALDEARAAAAIEGRLAEPAATFVTLRARRADGELALRGCIGTLEAVEPLHASVVANTRRAAFHDPRFEPLSADELPGIVVGISVLTPPVEIDGPGRIVPGQDGVRMECGPYRAVFLPEVATEYGWSRDELLAQLARKAGMPSSELPRARWWVFRSESFGE